jgi:hypothetical protein
MLLFGTTEYSLPQMETYGCCGFKTGYFNIYVAAFLYCKSHRGGMMINTFFSIISGMAATATVFIASVFWITFT